MPIRLNGSTSGYSELSAPAVAGNNSIALPTGNGSAYQRVSNGAAAGALEFIDNIVSGTAQNSTSGTSIDFTGIPSWAKRVTIMFNGVSLANFASENNSILVQLGNSSGIENSSYTQSSSYVGASSGILSRTDGFHIAAWNAAGNTIQGVMQITKHSGNLWCAFGTSNQTAGFTVMTAGSKNLSGALDRIRITTPGGTDTFDAGSINIMYE
jgi:hypothetical protein